MAEMKYPEFRKKLIDLVREVVTQLPELRPEAKFLGEQLGDPKENGDLMLCFEQFCMSISVEDLKQQLLDFVIAANHATTYGCTQKQFESWKYNKDLKMAIEQAIGKKSGEIRWDERDEEDAPVELE